MQFKLTTIHDRGETTSDYPLLSRFVFVGVPNDGSARPFLRHVHEREISEWFDMRDAHGEAFCPYRYLDDDYQLVEITEGPQTRSDDPEAFIYAHAPMLAGGEDVGTIHYTDH